MTEPKEAVHFGPSLTLAEKWMNETGRGTRHVLSDPLPDGTRLPLLLVTHGPFQVIVREQGSCIAVGAQIQIPDDVRKKLVGLSPEDQQRLSITLRAELSSNGRTAYSYHPQDVTSTNGLEGFMVEELLKIAENDVGSFNRFCDAVQEVVTIAGKGIAVLGLFTPSQSPSTTAVRSAPGSLYG